MKDLGYCVNCGESDHSECFIADCKHEVCPRCRCKCAICDDIVCGDCLTLGYDLSDEEMPEISVCLKCAGKAQLPK